jgi:hypothetical protein
LQDAGREDPGGSPPPLPRGGGPLCLTFECLLISGIRHDLVGEAQLRRECEEYGPVRKIIMLIPSSQALVYFGDIR